MDKDMHSLKEILLDAARYRWLRKRYIVANMYDESDKLVMVSVMGDKEHLDADIDEQLRVENES